MRVFEYFLLKWLLMLRLMQYASYCKSYLKITSEQFVQYEFGTFK